ncbi:hypothetical protein RUND412_009185 [Rhizina undulata]
MANNRLITGAYIIRLKKTPFAVDIDDMNRAYVRQLDAHKRRENQVWWVEPLPHYEDDVDARRNGRVYTITNVATNKCLDLVDVLAAKGSAAEVNAMQSCGLPWQKWRIKRVEDGDGDYYTLTNFHTGTVLDSDVQIRTADRRYHCRERNTPSTTQRWGFVVPLVAVPPAGSKSIIPQTTVSCNKPTPPCRLDVDSPAEPRRSLDADVLAHQEPAHGGLLGFREQVYKNSKKRNVHANEVVPTSDNALQWSGEVDTEGRWEIVNQGVKYPLMARVIDIIPL